MVKIILVTSDEQGDRQAVNVTNEFFLIGTNPECHLRIQDPAVSPVHCAICSHPDFATLLDLGSWQGTTINGRFFRNGILGIFDQDTLQLGLTKITIGISAVTESSSEPSATINLADSQQSAHPTTLTQESLSVKTGRRKYVEVVKAGRKTVISFRSLGLPKNASIHGFHTELLEILDTCQTEVLGVDLYGVKYIPSALLGVLCSARQRIEEVHLYRASSNVRNILQIANLDQLMPITEAPGYLE